MNEKKQAPPRRAPHITKMKSRDIPTAVESWRLAFENDPLRRTTPELREPTTIIDHILDWSIAATTWAWGLLRSAELKKRRKEVLGKITSATESIYGDRVKDMVHIDGLATSPQSQGRGYAGALLDAVTAKADTASRATYLESSNVANTGFYESHGFITVGEIVCGDDNPAWKEPPVVVKLADAASQATYLESSNVANTGFYESHGFRVVGEIVVGDVNPAWKESPVVVKLADAASRATYLESSNVANTGFYESHGFRTIGEIQYGGDNPTWKEPPVVVKLPMSDRPRVIFASSMLFRDVDHTRKFKSSTALDICMPPIVAWVAEGSPAAAPSEFTIALDSKPKRQGVSVDTDCNISSASTHKSLCAHNSAIVVIVIQQLVVLIMSTSEVEVDVPLVDSLILIKDIQARARLRRWLMSSAETWSSTRDSKANIHLACDSVGIIVDVSGSSK
ncbi:hypothetical protein CCMSSC00406_0001005 [Pleurotus cornucopiae]|uniref:Uncharacterized protein n=1 Tax=Pleurotus cornucopiae TaxID=5321 RepID=A0ACB7IM10_PLECO|nr:hypothetical protein CCMSSC00406_0001005 [Pleurotus cornucopiae]